MADLYTTEPTGFRVRLCIEAEKELRVLGCGWRIVTVELDGPNVHLHHNGNTATMKRGAFKEFLVANRAARPRKKLESPVELSLKAAA